MKQIQIKEYQKNTISKAKSKRKLTRLEQLLLSDEDRRLIYDRRSSSYLLKKQRKSKSPYLSDRKLIRFLIPFSVSLEKKRERSNELYLYNYNNTTKSEYMSNEQRYASVVTNLNKIYKNEEIQPDYPDWPKKKPILDAKPYEKTQQRENSKPTSAKKLFPRALVGKAQRIWEEAQKKPYSLLKAKRELAQFKEYYPEGIDNFNHWYNSSEAIGFKKWITGLLSN